MPEKLLTLGDHIRKRRLETHQMQQDVAEILQVTESCINNWENNRYKPQIQYYPKIICFLGYYPFQYDRETIGSTLLMHRQLYGFDAKRMGELLGVDGTTVRRWELNKIVPSDEILFKYFYLAPKVLVSLS